MKVRLTEIHPLDIKFRELEKFMEDNDLALEWNGCQMIFKSGVEQAYIRDNDSGEPCMEVPYICETKLVIED